MKIWLYWDNPPGRAEPPKYIQLCWQSIQKHCGSDFEINLVTTANVKQYLPQIPDHFFQIAQINNKSNYLRYTLLAEHGGIWLDSDLVLFQSLLPLAEFLKDGIDLVATASPTLKYGEPESGFILSQKGGKVITKAAELIDRTIQLHPPGHIFKWGSLGPAILRKAVNGRRYHHLDHRFLMPIPSWSAYRFGGNEQLSQCLIEDSFGCMLFHEMFRQANDPILHMNEQQLMKSPCLLSQIFRKALA